jgi:hypothetical protein
MLSNLTVPQLFPDFHDDSTLDIPSATPNSRGTDGKPTHGYQKVCINIAAHFMVAADP